MLKSTAIVLKCVPVILFIFLVSCSKSRIDEDTTPDLSLLGEQVVDEQYHFQFSPPAGWVKMNPKLKDKIISEGYSNKKARLKFIKNTKYFFFEDSSSAIMNLALISYYDTLTGGNLFSDYLYVQRLNFSKNEFNEDEIKIGGKKAVRWEFSESNITTVRLVIFYSGNVLIQIDYTLNKSFFNESESKIKNSMNSISFNQ